MTDTETGSGLSRYRMNQSGSTDNRTIQTRASIIEAFEQLIAESGRIPDSVSAVARTAGIGRQTFYTHFSGLDDLMVTILRDEIAGIAAQEQKSVSHVADGNGYPGVSARSLERATRAVTEYLGDHRTMYAVLLGPSAPVTVADVLVDAVADATYAHMVQVGGVPEGLDARTQALQIAGAFQVLLSRWVRGEVPGGVDDIVRQNMALHPVWLHRDPSGD